MKTPRELVYETLEFKNPSRVPRQLWILPWAQIHYPEKLQKIQKDFPDDIISAPGYYTEFPKTYGNPYAVGEYIDEWGCKFTNYQEGIIGEIKDPLVKEEGWEDVENIHLPYELLNIDIAKINEFCGGSDKFVMASACPRPFERLQFIRGTEQLYIDLMLRPARMDEFIKRMHDYYCQLLTAWAKTDVDSLSFMDDWGSQNTLLINPDIWVEMFKPLYRDYIDIAHSFGKKIFMHSDGHIFDIFPHLIELGLDAINSQIFCMDMDKLKEYRGKITFWGEIDRQHILANGSLEEVRAAVNKVKDNLWDSGGCIAQGEFSIGSNPDNVYEMFKAWDEIGLQ